MALCPRSGRPSLKWMMREWLSGPPTTIGSYRVAGRFGLSNPLLPRYPRPRSVALLENDLILSLDHVAIAVPDLDDAIRRFADDLGLALSGTEDVASAVTRTAFLPVAGPTRVELVAPLDGQGPLVKQLEQRGPGLHHLCFRTDDLDGDVARLRAKGWRFTTEAPFGGAHGTRVMFVHPKSAGGVLIELAEHPADRSGAP